MVAMREEVSQFYIWASWSADLKKNNKNQTDPVCLFAIVHPSAHPLYAGGPVGVGKRACVHWRYLKDKRGVFITGNVIESTPPASAYISIQ